MIVLISAAVVSGFGDKNNDAIKSAIESGDFEAWREAVIDSLTEEKFNKLVSRYNGDWYESKGIYTFWHKNSSYDGLSDHKFGSYNHTFSKTYGDFNFSKSRHKFLRHGR